MANMSHCRFENTANDMAACFEHMEDELKSEYEIKARERLLKLCQKFVDNYGPDPED